MTAVSEKHGGEQPHQPGAAVRKHGRRRWWRWLAAGAFAAALPVISMVLMRLYTLHAMQDHIYSREDVPARRVAVVFGARVFSSGRLSPMLADRVATAADLYRDGKVDALLLTGDNSQANYNEPEAMRRYARQLGVPDEALVLDYAGFRTYDSCYRARDVFQVEDAILVTQDFHLSRALLTCRSLGIDAVGVVAEIQRPRGYLTRSVIYSELREIPATALAVLDVLREPEPAFLGDPIPIHAERP